MTHRIPSRHGSARSQTKTPGLLQLEAQSEHLLQASPQKRAARRSRRSTRWRRHVVVLETFDAEHHFESLGIFASSIICMSSIFMSFHAGWCGDLKKKQETSRMSTTTGNPGALIEKRLYQEDVPSPYSTKWLIAYQVGMGRPVPKPRHRCYFSLRRSLNIFCRLLLGC